VYTPHTQSDIEQMLETVGVPTLEALLRVPDAVALKRRLDLPEALPETLLVERLNAYALQNKALGHTSFLGAGAYRHYCPPVVGSLAMRGEFLTAYTPRFRKAISKRSTSGRRTSVC